MELHVNGDPRRLPDGLTVAQLLETLKIVPERVVVEVNLAILKRAQHPGTVLRDGDQVEIVQFVGGGSGCMPQATSRRPNDGALRQSQKPAACSLQPELQKDITCHG